MRPLHGTYCFSSIPGTIEKLLRGITPLPILPKDVLGEFDKRYSTIVTLLVDAMGWLIVERCLENIPSLRRVSSEGKISCITSQFPSTTAAHLATIHTGLSVEEHGVFEWYYYEPIVNRVIAPLLMSGAFDIEKDSLLKEGIKPSQLLPNGDFYGRLLKGGIRSFIFQSALFTPSAFLSTLAPDAQVIPFENLEKGTRLLSDHILSHQGANYYFMYVHTLDSICHEVGPYHEVICHHLSEIFSTLERNLFDAIRAQSDDALLIICADHGQISVSPRRTEFLNTKAQSLQRLFPETLPAHLRFSGSARDLFLYPTSNDQKICKVVSDALTENVPVHTLQSLVDVGVFLNSSVLLSHGRLGNLVLLPRPGYQISLSEIGKPEWNFNGHHGGMSFEEMAVPFICIPGSQL
jgi:hypothetical protein